MRCMTTKTTHGDKDPNPRNKYNLTPETARVGVQIGKVISGVLHPVGIPHFFFNNYRLVSVDPKFLLPHMMFAILRILFSFLLAV